MVGCGATEVEAGAVTGWGLGVLGEEQQAEWRGGTGPGTGTLVGEGSGRRPAAWPLGEGRRKVGSTGSGPSGGPAPARPPTWARWAPSSQSHQPDSPRGRLRRQTAMHRAPPPATAPQPACAIARPPARSLPRAVSRFQGHRTVLSGRRASTGPGTRMQNTGHGHPEPPPPGPPSQLSWFLGPCSRAAGL